VIVFENGSSAVQSVNEATIKGQKANSQSADLTLLSPGSFSLVFGPRSIPRALPLLIPLAYSALDTYLKGPSVVEEIAQLLERMGVSSEVLRGPEIRQSDQGKRNWRDDKPLSPGEIKQLEKQGWNHRQKGRHGGQRDLYKDKEGNVYEKPKGGNGPGELIDYNLK